MPRYDRRLVPADDDKLFLDLPTFDLVPPETGIYEEPVRWYCANLKWAKLIEGFCVWMTLPTVWRDAEDENYIGVQEIMTFLEGREPTMSIDYDALMEAIASGVYKAGNNFAKQIVSGRTTNINVDDEGGVSDPSEGDGTSELPEDDPATAINETAAANMGGAIGVRLALKLFFDKIDNYYGPTNGTPVTSAADTKAQILAYFPCELVPMELAIDDYYTYRASNARHVFTPTSAFDQYLYCKGANRTSFSRWLADVSGYPLAKQINMAELANALSDEFWTSYFAYGTNTPSTGYVEASCTPIATEEFTLNFALADSFTIPLAGILKAGHRYLLEATGSFTDSDVANVVQDFFWKIDTSTGVKTFTGFTLSVAGTTNATAAQVPYQASHKYAWTFDKTGTDGGTFSKNNDVFTIPNVTGIVLVKLTDLGEFAL